MQLKVFFSIFFVIVCIFVTSCDNLTTSKPNPSKNAPTTAIVSASPEITTTALVTSISQFHELSATFFLNETFKSTEMAISDSLQLIVADPSSKYPNAYISDDKVIKQIGKSYEMQHPPGQGIVWRFIFQATAEGTSSINIRTASEGPELTFPVVVTNTFLIPTRPKYNVTFKVQSPVPVVLWSVNLGGQQSISRDANPITFIGVPNGTYYYSFDYSLIPSDGRKGTGDDTVAINGADKEVIVTLSLSPKQ
jgi:hypothetical protein